MNLVKFRNPYYAVNGNLVDELFNSFLSNDYHENYLVNTRKPSTNVFETNNNFTIELMLPGFAKDDVQMNYHKNILTIKVEKEEVTEENKVDYKYSHREFGVYNFEKNFKLPNSVDAEKIDAKFENGILTVVLPKKEEALEKEPVSINIS
ncbi:MAG: Hsp20/alpha crystallin family protein [Draconibacterium sp.]